MITITEVRPEPSTPIGLNEENEFATGEIWGRMRLYRVLRISTNTNSFGLTGVWIMRRNGETWELGMNHLNLEGIRIGSILKVAQMHLDGARPDLTSWGEIPRRIQPDPPPEIIAKVWKGATVADIIGWPNDRNRL